MENYVFKILLTVFIFVFNVSSCRVAKDNFYEDDTLKTKVNKMVDIKESKDITTDVIKSPKIIKQPKINKQKIEEEEKKALEIKKIEQTIEKREQLKSDLQNILQKLDSI
jgi:hypothetical protein